MGGVGLKLKGGGGCEGVVKKRGKGRCHMISQAIALMINYCSYCLLSSPWFLVVSYSIAILLRRWLDQHNGIAGLLSYDLSILTYSQLFFQFHYSLIHPSFEVIYIYTSNIDLMEAARHANLCYFITGQFAYLARPTLVTVNALKQKCQLSPARWSVWPAPGVR